MKNLAKVGRRRIHKERAQPQHRRKFGLLQKHSDYKVRARDYNLKQKRLRALREKAALRNPDEFYFGMINAQTTNGIHMLEEKQNQTEHSSGVFKKCATQVGMVQKLILDTCF